MVDFKKPLEAEGGVAIRADTSANLQSITPAADELAYNTSTNTIERYQPVYNKWINKDVYYVNTPFSGSTVTPGTDSGQYNVAYSAHDQQVYLRDTASGNWASAAGPNLPRTEPYRVCYPSGTYNLLMSSVTTAYAVDVRLTSESNGPVLNGTYGPRFPENGTYIVGMGIEYPRQDSGAEAGFIAITDISLVIPGKYTFRAEPYEGSYRPRSLIAKCVAVVSNVTTTDEIQVQFQVFTGFTPARFIGTQYARIWYRKLQ